MPSRDDRAVARARVALVEVRVLSSTIAHGSLGLGGDLGYEGKRVSVAGATDAGVISAHGPSEVRIAAAAGTELRLRGAINDDVRGERIAASFVVEDGAGRPLAFPGLALPGTPTPTVGVTVPPGGQLVLRCHATTRHACHAVWIIERSAVSCEEPRAASRAVSEAALGVVRTVAPGPDTAHALYLQTSAARAELALRSVATHLLAACVRPRRVVVFSPDGGVAELAARLPPWCEVWSELAPVEAALEAAGLSAPARARVTARPALAREAIPRLAMGDRVLVSDDDLLWSGPCEELLRAEADVASLADHAGGGRAGLYLLNRRPISAPQAVADLLEQAAPTSTEPRAVVPEVGLAGVSTAWLAAPKYLASPEDGPPGEAELVQLHGPAAPRAEGAPALEAVLVARALREHHERARVAAGRRAGTRRIAALISVGPSDAEALDLCLQRAAEVGVLAGLERLVVVETAPATGHQASDVRAVCDRHGAAHRREEPDGDDTPPPATAAARILLRQLAALARAAPGAEWLLPLEPGLLLDGDLWGHLVRRGLEADADVSADLRPEDRFDPAGHLAPACAAVSSATALALGALAARDGWRRIERHLFAESDAGGDVGVAVTMALRLLGRRIVAPERRRGLLSVREVSDPNDRALWAPAGGAAPLAFSVARGHDRAGRARRLLERLRRGPADDPAVTDVSGMRNELCRVLSAEVGAGALRLDGTLGYDGGCCPRPLCGGPLVGHSLLSAHGPSRVQIELDQPVELFGFLNASARFDPHNPVEFWVDWNFVGETCRPGAVSSTVRLDRGPHVLAVACRSRDTRHTLWAMRPASQPATERRLTVVTIAAYAPERVPAEIGILARSAHKHGIHLDVCFVGEGYASHTEMKIRRLRRAIAALPGGLVLYTDARDCFFLTGAADIERQFAGLGAPLVASSEAQAWPISERSWADRFPRRPGGCNWLNAGQWMGERAAILSALETLEELDDRAQRPPEPGELRDLALYRSRLADDQLLWQVADLNRLFPLALDHEGRVFRNVYTLDMQLCDNRDFAFGDGALSYRISGQRPCVLHFSGWGAAYAMHQWGARLGGY
ncbi:MAG TPA: hypothetical protein VKZ18_00600 [Polyangia bacterium]|nr:hypothetical protein [Polyangia bacterium]